MRPDLTTATYPLVRRVTGRGLAGVSRQWNEPRPGAPVKGIRSLSGCASIDRVKVARRGSSESGLSLADRAVGPQCGGRSAWKEGGWLLHRLSSHWR